MESFEQRIIKVDSKEISGNKFNELFSDIEFVKLTNIDELHRSFQYNDGENSDTNEFTPYGVCIKGGLYFTPKDFSTRWIFYDSNIGVMSYMRKVTIPDDARVYIKNGVFKTDKFVLSHREKIDVSIYQQYLDAELDNFSTWGDNPSRIVLKYLFDNKIVLNKEFYARLINYDGLFISYIPEHLRDYDICLRAACKEYAAFSYIPKHIINKTIYIEALKNRSIFLKHVPYEFRDIDVCKQGLANSYGQIEYVPDDVKQYLDLNNKY